MVSIPILTAEIVHAHALDISKLRHGNYRVGNRNQIFHGNIIFVKTDGTSSVVTIFVRKKGLAAINLREEDELIEVKFTDNTKDILMVTKYGQCIRFHETDVRSTGRTSMGVIGMNLSDRDEIVGMQMDTQGEYLLIASEKGLGKLTRMEEFTPQNRGGKGVKCYKITDKTGNIIGVKAVNQENEIMMITTEGIIIRMKVEGISVLGRVTSGVKLMNLDDDITVASIAKVREDQSLIENTEDGELLTEEEAEQSAKLAEETARRMNSPVEETNEALIKELIERAESDQED